MNNEKVKAFIARIVEECEQEGFTLGEALQVPQELRFALNNRVEEIKQQVNVRGFRVVP